MSRAFSTESASPSPQAIFQRTQTTWLAYFLLSFYAFMAAMFGPLLPSLRAELSMNYRLGGLHLSAPALGIILAGLVGGQLAQRRGHRLVLRLGGCSAKLQCAQLNILLRGSRWQRRKPLMSCWTLMTSVIIPPRLNVPFRRWTRPNVVELPEADRHKFVS